MNTTIAAYRKHDFIRTSIDLLCAGVSWRGGTFLAHPAVPQDKILPILDEQSLTRLAKSMLLEGKALVAVTTTQGTISLAQIQSAEDAKDETIISIERVESSFSPGGEPILERVSSNIELYEKALEQSLINPAVTEILNFALPSIHSALAIPSVMLDETRFTQVPVQALMMGAIQYQAEVESLRHNLRFGLNEVCSLIAEAMDIEVVEWDWNEEWITSGPCKFGHVYQVFRSKGIALDPIMNSELGGMKLALQARLISNQTYAECAASYGIH